MSTSNQGNRFGQRAVVVFALLAGWLVLLRFAEDLGFISPLAESLLRFAPCTAVLGAMTHFCWRSGASRAIRVTLLFLSVAVCSELFLSVSSHIPAWDHVPVIGRRNDLRPMLKHLLFGGWVGSALLLVSLSLRSAAESHQRLKKQSRMTELFFTHALSQVVFLDKQFNFIRVNEAYARACGRDISEFPGHNHFDFYPSDTRQIFEEVVATKQPYQTNSRPFVFPDHPEWEVTYWDWTLVPVLDEDGDVEVLVFSLNDVTARKQAEKSLRESETRFRTYTEATPFSVAVIQGKEMRHRYVNQAMADRTGYSREELLKMNALDYIHPDCRDLVEQRAAARQRGEAVPNRYEIKIITKEGEKRYVDLCGTRIEYDGKPAILATTLDITERKRAEKQLQLTQSAVDAAIEGIFWVKPDDGRFAYVNAAACRSLGYDRDELLTLGVPDVDTNLSREAWPQFSQMVRKQGTHALETALRRKNGETFPVDIVVNHLQSEGTEFFCAYARDISVRKHAENALRLSEEKYKGIFDDSLAAVYVFDAEKNFIDSNQAGLDLLGYSREELLGMSIPDVDAEPKTVLPAHEQLLSRQKLVNYEHQLKHKDGTIVTVLNNSRPLIDREGGIVGLQSTLVDITERRRAEEALEESRQFIEAIAAAAPYFIYVIDIDSHEISYFNRPLALELGYEDRAAPTSLEDLLQFMPSEEHSHFGRVIEEWNALEIGDIREDEYYLNSADGTLRLFLGREMVFVTSRQKASRQILGTSFDITKRKRAEGALRNIAEGTARAIGDDFFQSLVRHLATTCDCRHVMLAKLIGDDKARVRTIAIWTNGELAENFEYSLAGTPCEKVVQNSFCSYPRDVQQLFPDDRLLVDMNVEGYLGIPLVATDGSVVGLLAAMNCHPVTEGSEIKSILEIFAARAAAELERKRIEEELRSSEQRFRSIFEQAGMAVGLIESETGRFVEINSKYTSLIGYSSEELAGMTWMEITYPDDVQADADNMERLVAGEIRQYTMEKRLTQKDGSVIWVNLTVSPIWNSDEEPKHHIIIVEDITARKQAEEENRNLHTQLLHSQKMDAIGQLAAGVAHEFNNLLVGIRSNTELLQRMTKDYLPDNLKRALKGTERAGARAFTLTRQLLSFARKNAPNLAVFDLNRVVANSEQIFQRLVGENISLKTQLSPDTLLVRADESELEQAILNLVLNARDAMPSGGPLIIRTRSILLEENDVSQDCQAGRFVQLSVVDQGCGMSAETIDRVFEPFFTTKPSGQGTGLGLSTVYSDIAKSNGFVSIESREGVGTTVNIHLPLSLESADVQAEANNDSSTGGDETILVCDDEELVLSSVCAMLEAVGYTVIGVKSASEALKEAAAHVKKISLLLTDITMPETSGFELGQEIHRRYPDMKIIYSSGYSADRIEMRDAGDDIEFLDKGGSTDVMLQQIQRVLGKDGPPDEEIS